MMVQTPTMNSDCFAVDTLTGFKDFNIFKHTYTLTFAPFNKLFLSILREMK